jgi:hypothetical protein
VGGLATTDERRFDRGGPASDGDVTVCGVLDDDGRGPIRDALTIQPTPDGGAADPDPACEVGRGLTVGSEIPGKKVVPHAEKLVSTRKRSQAETVSPCPGRYSYPAAVPRKSAPELEVEKRIAAHVRRYMVQRRIGLSKLARRLEMHKGTVSKILWLDRGIDAYFVWAVHVRLHISADVLLEDDPDQEFFRPGPPAIPEGDGDTPSAGPSAAAGERRRRDGRK